MHVRPREWLASGRRETALSSCGHAPSASRPGGGRMKPMERGRRGTVLALLLVAATSVLTVSGSAAAAKPAAIKVSNCKLARLIDAIEEANATATADTIELKKGCTYNVTSVLPGTEGGLPTIVAPLTIHGNGATIARDPSAPPLQLIHVRGWTEPEGFVVDDLTVRGGAAPKGGAILVTPWFGPDGPIASAPSVAVSDSTFVDNRTVAIDAFDQGGVGGAIAVEGWPGGERSPVTLVNDTFTDNATHDGPLYDDPNQCPQCSWDTRSGGAVSIGGAGVTTIAGCTFTSNRTGDGPANDGGPWTGWYSHGGAVYVNNGSATVSDSVFTGNATGSGGSGQNGGGGGAIAVEGGSLTVTGSTFTGNATGSGGDASAQAGEGGRGGAVSLDNRGTPSFLRVVDSTFTGNATGDGGVGATRAGAGPGGP